MPNIGIPELLIVLVILLVVFGPKRLPSAGRALGTGLREFKDSISGKDDDENTDVAGLPSAPVATAEPSVTAEPVEDKPAEHVSSEPRS